MANSAKLIERQSLRKVDLREAPMYTVAEAALHLGLPRATLRSWVFGRQYRAGGKSRFSPGIIHLPNPPDERLSFTNLAESHVLRGLRVEHEVSMPLVRKALAYAETELGIPRILISDKLRAAPGEMFLKEYGRLLSLTVAGQLAMERLLEQFLKRLERGVDGIPIRLYPFTAPEVDDHCVVSIDPRIAYGRPSISRKGISTAILAERANTGETIEDLAACYSLTPEEVTEAIIYEGSRAAAIIHERPRSRAA